jgi:hypothetical protein
VSSSVPVQQAPAATPISQTIPVSNHEAQNERPAYLPNVPVHEHMATPPVQPAPAPLPILETPPSAPKAEVKGSSASTAGEAKHERPVERHAAESIPTPPPPPSIEKIIPVVEIAPPTVEKPRVAEKPTPSLEGMVLPTERPGSATPILPVVDPWESRWPAFGPPPVPAKPAAMLAAPEPVRPAVQPNPHTVNPTPTTPFAAEPAHTGDPVVEARIELCRARQLFFAGHMEEARQVAVKLGTNHALHWGHSEDSPDKLLEDIHQACVRRDREASSQILAEARKLYQQGKLDEAERRALVAAQLHGPYTFFDLGDRPDRLLHEIATARSHNHPAQPAKPVTVSVPVVAVRETPPSANDAGTHGTPPKSGSAADVKRVPPPVTGLSADPLAVSKPAGHSSEIVTVAAMASAPAQPDAPAAGPVLRFPSTPPLPVTPAALQMSAEVEPTPSVTAPAVEESNVVTSPMIAAPLPAGPPNPPAPPTNPKNPPSTTVVGNDGPLACPVPPPGPVFHGETHMAGCAAPEADCCSQPCDHGLHAYADVGFSILFPYWRNNPAFTTLSTPTPVAIFRQTDFNYNGQFVPQLALGVQSANGLGARISWWGFAASNATATNVPALSAAPLSFQVETVPGRNFAAFSNLRFNVWDFEATEEFRWSECWLLLSGGLRYAHLSQTYVGVASDATGTTEVADSGHNFDGYGPTIALNANRWVGSMPVYLYGNIRGSLLFGTAKQAGGITGNGELGPAQVAVSTDTILPVAELELGVGSAYDVGPARVSLRAGVLGQAWFDAGNSSRSAITTLPFITSVADPTLGLFGFTMRAEVEY